MINVSNAINYILFLLFIAVSGGQYFYLMNGKYFVSLFFVLSILLHVYRNGGIVWSKSSTFLVVGSIYLLFNYFFINSNHSGNTFLPQMMMFVGSYFFISSYSYEEIKLYYLNSIVFLAVLSVIVYLGATAGLLQSSFVNHPNGSAVMCMMHKMGGYDIDTRLSGIFWEPGAYQIPLSMTLFLYFNNILDGDLFGSERWKILIILVVLLLTRSTAAFLMLGLLVGYYIYKKIRTEGLTHTTIWLSVISVAGIGLLFYSSTVQDKFNQVSGSDASSYNIRMNDNLAMLQMIGERPIFGFGQDSVEGRIRGNELGNITSSNGILQMISSLGLAFFLMYIYFLYQGIKKIFSQKVSFAILALFMFLQAFEVYWYFPVAFIFLFCCYEDEEFDESDEEFEDELEEDA